MGMNTLQTQTDKHIHILYYDIFNMTLHIFLCNRCFQVTKTILSIICGIKYFLVAIEEAFFPHYQQEGYEINYIAHISRIKHLVNIFLCVR